MVLLIKWDDQWGQYLSYPDNKDVDFILVSIRLMTYIKTKAKQCPFGSPSKKTNKQNKTKQKLTLMPYSLQH